MSRARSRRAPRLVLRLLALPLLAFLFAACREPAEPAPERAAEHAREPTARFEAVGPRLVSNRARRPLLVYGAHLPDGATLVLGTDPPLRLATTRIDADLRGAALPAGAHGPGLATLQDVSAHLEDAAGRRLRGEATLTLVDDARYPRPDALARVGSQVAVASRNTDTLHVFEPSGPPTSLPVGDGPVALTRWGEALLVLHADRPALWVHAPGAPRILPAPAAPQDLAVDGDTAWISSRHTDALHPLDLRRGTLGAPVPAGPNPRRLDAAGGVVLAGALGSGALVLHDGVERLVTAPSAATTIVGGPTEPFQRWVMGGKAARDVVLAPALGVAFVSSVGPNVGPNPDRMEVSMNGGVSVVDLASGAVLRHRSIERGIPEGLAYDRSRGLLFAADMSTGRVVVLDAAALAASDDAARGALLGALALPPPAGVRLVRPERDFGGADRAGLEVHTGPRHLALGEGATLHVLCALSRELVTLDTTRAEEGVLRLRGRRRLPFTSQPRRRVGETLYYTDLGLTHMSCDGCHHDGDADGLLFTKGQPMHVYRSPSLWQARETPPFFTPALFPSLAFTADFVLGRNRFHRPDPSRTEVLALARFQETITAPPSPHRRADGGFPESVTLPGGREGDPVAGWRAFRERGCARCHPGPEHTTDQDPATRGRLHDVGTPVALPLRPAMQDDAPYPLPPPGLVGVHDRFPLLHSGAGGFDVVDGAVEATHPNALRRVLELGRESGAHGELGGADDAALDDLEAFLRML
ncbi:MAG: MtsA protein [Myxococcales bacterium]|nr:MtsA protein [Myxococcales bacterium]